MRRRFFNNNKEYFDINDYLTIEALEDNLQIYFPYEDLMYGIDGLGWQKLIAGKYSPPINTGQTISFKGNVSSTAENKKSFTITKKCNLLGNCMSLTSNDTPYFFKLFDNCTTIVYISKDFLPATTLVDYCYYSMFYGCSSLTTAPALPATTLADRCYSSMFQNCTSLTSAPALPATTLATHCYNSMFCGCSSLTTVPALPATILKSYCYYSMFNYCTNLTTAPALPATILASDCYSNMFRDCTNLTTAPELPATTLADGCYNHMFNYCTNLTTAPALPATTLADGCYRGMFSYCNKLNYIKMLATDISARDCLYNWVENVSPTGTFVKNPSMTTLSTGVSGIPYGWTVVNDGEEN